LIFQTTSDGTVDSRDDLKAPPFLPMRLNSRNVTDIGRSWNSQPDISTGPQSEYLPTAIIDTVGLIDQSTVHSQNDSFESFREQTFVDRHSLLPKFRRLVSPLYGLRKETILNEIRSREVRREPSFEREVAACDGRFMRELHKL
jgi:hypothetical protein